MTSPDTARPAPLRLREPGDLVAAVPVMLGFHPRDSLVLVATGGPSGHTLGLTLRVDLPPPEHDGAVARAVVRSLIADRPVGAAVIVIGGRRGADPRARRLVDRVVQRLESRGVDIHTVIAASSTAAGAAWHCYDPCGCRGEVPDPDATPMAAAAVAGGQVVFAERADLERLVLPADAERIRRRERLLVRSGGDLSAFCAPETPAEGRSSGIAIVDAALEATDAGRLNLDDAQVVALATALSAPLVRDTAMLRCTGDRGPAAEHLWAALCRETPDPEAADPAALLAVSALLRGDGALANVALDRAERAWPGHRLTGLLRSVADAGVRPSRFRAWLSSV